MFKPLFGFKWQNSKAHLLLLSKFINPRTVDEFSRREEWGAVLKEHPQQAIGRFVKEGLLISGSLADKVDYKFKVTELKAMLKSRGLPVPGRKDELVSRLIAADPAGMEREVKGLVVLVCSEQGKVIAESFIHQEEEYREKVEIYVLELLKQRKFRGASFEVARYEAVQVFPRGMGIDWSKHDPSRDITALEDIFKRNPKTLSTLNEDQREQIRLAAGMMYLWGVNSCRKWLPKSFDTGLDLDNDVIARSLFMGGMSQASLDNYRRNSDVVVGVEILAAEDSCPECKKISGKRYSLNNPPELPYEHCTNKKGCRCCYIPVLAGKHLG